MIPLSVPNITGNEIKYVTEALETEWVSTAGAQIEAFEKKLAEYVGTIGAVACQSGTAGIHLALRYLGISERDAVIVPTLTFIAAVNPVKYEKADTIFMDCDDSLCMNPIKLKNFLQNECFYDGNNVFCKQTGKRVKAIVVVHVFGNMADMETIMEIAKQYHLYVIEDATEALGTYYLAGPYKGKFAGTIGDIGVYSFNGNKIITTGGGGMIVSNDKATLEKIKYLSTQAKDDVSNFIHNEIGYNYRMTNVQAAIGLAQLERLEEFIAVKERNYLHYKNSIEGMEQVEVLKFREDIRSNYWFYSLVIDERYIDKQELIEWFKEHQIQTRPIWGLISEQLPYKDSMAYNIESAYSYYEKVINLPCSTNLSDENVKEVLRILKLFLDR